jgi:hypothetical protein
MIKVHVNIATDKSAGVSTHMWFPVPVAVIYIPSIEMVADMDRGQAVNKLTSTVKHKSQNIVQDGHDSGRNIHDITVMPVNCWYGTFWPFSFRKIAFAASTVVLQGTPAGCADLTSWPPTPMLTCGDPITSPFGLAFSSSANTVLVGMTALDWVTGLFRILVTLAIDIVAFFDPEKTGILKNILKDLFKSTVVKWLIGAIAGITVSITTWQRTGGKTPLVITIPNPLPEGPSWNITYDPATDKWDSDLAWPQAPDSSAPSPSPTLLSPSSQESTGPFNSLSPSNDSWGHPLEPPDDRSGWTYDADKGWGMA